jgi:hypothetical protein
MISNNNLTKNVKLNYNRNFDILKSRKKPNENNTNNINNNNILDDLSFSSNLFSQSHNFSTTPSINSRNHLVHIINAYYENQANANSLSSINSNIDNDNNSENENYIDNIENNNLLWDQISLDSNSLISDPLNNAFLDIQFSQDENLSNFSEASTIAFTNFSNTSSTDYFLPFLFNHKLIPPGKENDDEYKINLINKIKSLKFPKFNSDFYKKRTHSEMMNYNIIDNNYINFNYSKRLNGNKIEEKNFNDNYNDIINNKFNTYKGGINECLFKKYRKIHSVKQQYSSFIWFIKCNKNKERIFFKNYRDEDLGIGDKFKKLTIIHVKFLLIFILFYFILFIGK